MTMGERIYLFDTTLAGRRADPGRRFLASPTRRPSRGTLDRSGIDYVEGGWPGANPTDDAFFADPPELKQRHLHRLRHDPARRPQRRQRSGLAGLIGAKCDAVCMVGKTWDFHVDVALNIPRDENLATDPRQHRPDRERKRRGAVRRRALLRRLQGQSRLRDACLLAAYEAGARWIVLCDTNGGTLPDEVESIVRAVAERIPGTSLGIHTHNDTENAVANSLAAVRAGARMVQGTLNGLGERCGNANLISLIPDAHAEDGLRDRHFRRGLAPALPCLAHPGRAAEPRAQPARSLCRGKRLRP